MHGKTRAESRPLRISTRNSTFQVLESLRTNRQKRHASGRCLVEGVLPINLALAHGWTFDAFAFEEGRPLSGWASSVIGQAPGAALYEMTGELLGALSGKTDTSELVGVLRTKRHEIGDVPVREDLLVAAVDRPSSPGNLGTLIRSCDALGVHALLVTGHAADVYDPAAITASRGSLFALPVVRLESHADVAAFASGVRDTLGGCRLVAADEQAALDLSDADLTGPAIVVVGNETHGLSHAYRSMCDPLVRIPMSGAATSLNISVAASIVLYEVGRQRRAKGCAAGAPMRH